MTFLQSRKSPFVRKLLVVLSLLIISAVPGVVSSNIASASSITATQTLSAGYSFSCAVRQTGSVQCWGSNSYGQLGNGLNTDSLVPVTVTGITNAVSISSGTYSACALLQTGLVYCWGAGTNGQLGNGSTTNSNVPVTVTGITNAVSISTGLYSACALLQTGSVQCWGSNYYGQLGNGSTTDSLVPVTVLLAGPVMISRNNSVSYASAGGTGSNPTQSAIAQGDTFTVASNSLTNPGFNFVGWTDGTNTYQPGATYTMGSSAVTLTALWITPPIIYSKPTSPSNVTAVLSNGTATVSFTPGSSGNLPTYNQIDMLINGQPFGNVCNVTGATSCPITNLGPDASFSFTVTAVNSKGSATSSVSNVVSYASPKTVPPTTTTTTTTVPHVKQTITCVKGKITKKVTAVSPVCPAGYKKK